MTIDAVKIGPIISFGAATVAERKAAFRLVFPTDLCDERLARAESLIRTGQLDPDSVRVARDSIGLAAAMIAAPLPGAGAIVWPPLPRSSLHFPSTVLNSLCDDTVKWLQENNIRVAQSLLSPDDVEFAAPLLQSGFSRITRLCYMRHALDLPFDLLVTEEKCRYQNYDDKSEHAFLDVLNRSYQDTLDCPELNDVRTPAQVLAGHRAAGPFDPDRWWLASIDSKPVGIVLVTMPEIDAWDVAYLGVVPEARRRGIGSELVRKLLFEAKANGAPMVTLAVDERNGRAKALYHAAGFELYDERDVYLKVFGPG